MSVRKNMKCAVFIANMNKSSKNSVAEVGAENSLKLSKNY